MAQHVAYPGNLRPWNFWMPGFQLVAQVPASLGDDLNAALDQPTLAFVGFQVLKRHARHLAADQLGGFDDVGETRNRQGRRHQNTCRAEASIRSRRTGCKLRRVIMSVLRPRIRAAASFTSINSKSPRDPSGWSKNRSTSEFSRASPRAVEPNR